jgi:hypothetical protein
MAGKSKHGKKKRYQQINKPKNIPNTGAVTAAMAPTDAANRPAAAVNPAAVPKPAPAGKPAAPATGAKTVSYEYVLGDLKRTGILVAIIIVILIALKLILT